MIRVSGGLAKGRKLYGPKGLTFRPTTGRVKEHIFSILYQKVDDAFVLDLFSGSGSLGIEALSRGALSIYFIEEAFASLQLLKKNLHLCGFEKQSTVIKGDVFRQLQRLGSKHQSFDIILADPPFKENFREKIVNTVDRFNLLKIDGCLFIEHEQHDKDSDQHCLKLIKQKRFGHCVVSVYKREG